jgi:hypothetical protein
LADGLSGKSSSVAGILPLPLLLADLGAAGSSGSLSSATMDCLSDDSIFLRIRDDDLCRTGADLPVNACNMFDGGAASFLGSWRVRDLDVVAKGDRWISGGNFR